MSRRSYQDIFCIPYLGQAMMRLNAFFKSIHRPDSSVSGSKSATSIEDVTITHLLSKAHEGYRHVKRESIDKSRFSHRLQVWRKKQIVTK